MLMMVPLLPPPLPLPLPPPRPTRERRAARLHYLWGMVMKILLLASRWSLHFWWDLLNQKEQAWSQSYLILHAEASWNMEVSCAILILQDISLIRMWSGFMCSLMKTTNRQLQWKNHWNSHPGQSIWQSNIIIFAVEYIYCSTNLVILRSSRYQPSQEAANWHIH